MAASHRPATYVIDPKNHRTDGLYSGCLVVFWLIWAPVTGWVTWMAISDREPMLILWLVFGYAGTIVVPLVLLRRNEVQTLEVTSDSVIIHGAGLLPGSKYQIPRRSLCALTLEHREHGDGVDAVLTLNLVHELGNAKDRVMLAAFVHPEGKEVLLREIGAFLEGHGLKFEVKNEMEEQPRNGCPPQGS